MSAYTASSTFRNAASFLSTASSLSKVSSSIKLELYGLFKYITVSNEPTTSKPSIFDMTGRAKWDAWSNAGKTYKRSEDAEARYLDIARSLGWTEDAEAVLIPKQEERSSSMEEENWDDEDTSASDEKAGGGSNGMGLAVSSFAHQPEENDRSIHGLSLSDNVADVSKLLEQHPNIDLNEADEYGYTPLHLACDRGNIEMVKYLLSKGADPTKEDSDGLSPSELARVAGHSTIVLLLSSPS